MSQQRAEQGVDIDAYMRRIGYTGERTPTLATLRGIHTCHAQTIAFENLTPLLREPVRLDLPSLQHKLIHSGRGGYCFEQNLLLRAVLSELGFSVTGLAARVLWNAPEGAVTPRSHMLLLLDIDGQRYIADVGFGGMTLTAPLALVPDREQSTPHEPFRLVAAGAAYVLQARIGEEWKTLYSFELHEQHQPDYEVANWYVSTYPQSHFITSLVVARPDVGRRYALRNTNLAVHHLHGKSEQRVLQTVGELRAVLADTFRLSLPDTPDLDVALGRLIEQAS